MVHLLDNTRQVLRSGMGLPAEPGARSGQRAMLVLGATERKPLSSPTCKPGARWLGGCRLDHFDESDASTQVNGRYERIRELYDIVPDIHGQAEKLRGTLTRLGYRDRNGAWRHSNQNRQCVFLGDFIDRGPDNADVLNIVRRMIDAGFGLNAGSCRVVNAQSSDKSYWETYHQRSPRAEAALHQYT